MALYELHDKELKAYLTGNKRLHLILSRYLLDDFGSRDSWRGCSPTTNGRTDISPSQKARSPMSNGVLGFGTAIIEGGQLSVTLVDEGTCRPHFRRARP